MNTVQLRWLLASSHAFLLDFLLAALARRNWKLLGNGYAIEWPDLDEHIGIEGLLAGRRSGESPKSFKRWLAARRAERRTRTARV